MPGFAKFVVVKKATKERGGINPHKGANDI